VADAIKGVVLLSMGEPESLDAVRPYLRELLSDPDLVSLPVPFLRPAFAWGVSILGSGRLRRTLREMGGGSPLVRLTARQGQALEQALRKRGDFRVHWAMRYGAPSAQDAARRLQAEGAQSVVALPLYPQYCKATSGSSLKDLKERMREQGLRLPLREIRSWADHPGFVAALGELVARTLARAAGQKAHILFSAHSVPLSFIKAGDPYLADVERTVAAVSGVFPDIAHSLSFQSRGGRGEWLGPAIVDETERLARSGVEALVVVPVSFVCDHSETLHELDIELRRAAQAAGIRTFLRVPALNDSPLFIEALEDLVLRAEAAA